MNNVDYQYLFTAKRILEEGELRQDRTGTGTISLFSPPEMRFDLRQGFPLLTTKKLHIPSIVHELIWFKNGDTNIKYLQDNGIKIWDADYERWQRERGVWTDDGDLGPIYGKQWRNWEYGFPCEFGYHETLGIDQLHSLIEGLKYNPHGRRHIVSAWNVGELDQMALPPCHIMFQCYVSNDGGLSLKMYQR